MAPEKVTDVVKSGFGRGLMILRNSLYFAFNIWHLFRGSIVKMKYNFCLFLYNFCLFLAE